MELRWLSKNWQNDVKWIDCIWIEKMLWTNDSMLTIFYQTCINKSYRYRMSYQCYRFCDFELSSSLSTREHAGSKNRCQKLSRWCKKIINVIQKSDHHHPTFVIKTHRIKSFRSSLLVQKHVSLAFRPQEMIKPTIQLLSQTNSVITYLLIKNYPLFHLCVITFNQVNATNRWR